MASNTENLTRRSLLKGVTAFAIDASLFSVCLYFALTWNGLFGQCLWSLATGLMIALLFVVGHDAGHGSLTPFPSLNGVLGRVALLPSLHPLSLWKLGHNFTHHRWTNLATEDYVWSPLSIEQFRNLSRLQKLVYRCHRSWCGVVSYYLVEIWWKKMFVPSRKVVQGKYSFEHIFDLTTVYAFCFVWVYGLVVGGANGVFQQAPSMINPVVFGLVVPFLVWNVLMGFVTYLHHTHPKIRWFDDRNSWRTDSHQVNGAVHVIFPGPINLIFHRIMEHNAHHEHPAIPFYNLKSAQDRLEAQAIQMHWTIKSHLEIVRVCKLYDFESGRWQTYDGSFTSEATIPEPLPTPSAVPPIVIDTSSPAANPFVQN